MSHYRSTPTILFGGPATRTVKQLIILNIGIFVLQLLFRMFGSNAPLLYFGLIPRQVTYNFMIWQFFSYMFLHGGFFHILINMFTLFMFGNDLERRWGTRSFLQYYFITGIGAGICSWLVDLDGMTVIIGASGAVYAILLAYGLYYPNRVVYIYLLFPIKIKWLVLIMGAMAFFSSVTGGDPGVAHVAHLGGMLVGYIILKGQYLLDRLQGYRETRRREDLKRQFEVYYGEIRRKIDEEKKKPTIH